MRKATRAALYERVSTDEQSKFGFSIQNQIERLTKYAEENNLQIVEHYTDEGYSAGSMKRPSLQRMLNELHRFDIIIFTKLDRFTRNVLDANEMVKILDREGVAIRAIDEEDVDTTTADGMFMFNLKVSLAQRELKKGSERILSVFDYKVKHGQPISGSVTFGYKIEDVAGAKRVVKNEEEARIVEDMFDYFLKHQSIRQTALYINNKYDLNFAYLTYNRFLKRRIYTGAYRGNTEYCEPYISEKTFERVQEVIKNNIRVRKNNNIYLFSGLITCPKCGRRLTGICVENQYKVKYSYYRCDSSQMRHKCDFKSIREEVIEEFILQNINRLAKEYICTASVEIDKKPKPKLDIKEIQEEIDLLNYQFRKKRISVKEYDYEYEQLEKRLAEAKREMPEEADLSALQSFLNSGWENVYHALEKTDRRALLRSVIKELEIDLDGNIEVKFL